MKKLSSVEVLNKKIKIIYEEMEHWGECLMDDKVIKLSKRSRTALVDLGS
jgi:hypothetical protein